MFKRAAFIALAVILLALGGGAAVFAPQVFVLAGEGFPSGKWPAEGNFAQVKGRQSPAPSAASASLPAPALKRFQDKAGRVMMVDQAGAATLSAFAPGITAETKFNSFSLVKSLVGVLIVKASAAGEIALSDPLSNYLGPDAPKATIAQALEMRSGLVSNGEPAKSVDDGGFSPFGPLARLHAFGVLRVLKELESDPAAQGQFAYQSANTALLGGVLEQVYGQGLADILSEQIWQPAGASDAHWRTTRKGEVSAYCCLYASAEDWLKVGRFLLNNGTPNEPFLPPAVWQDWLVPNLAPAIRQKGHYGWHLRHDILDRPGQSLQGPFAYFMGHGGQMLYLLPSADVVVIRFGDAPQLLHSTLYELFP